MKRRRIIAAIVIVAAVSILLGGCTLPGVGPVDPINPVIPVVPVPAPITAAFDYSCFVYPIQTDSLVIFDGSDSSSPDGEIVWGKWEFGDDEELEGNWTLEGFWEWVNGERQWVELTWVMRVHHIYAETGSYTVRLTVWDLDGNSAETWRTVRVREL